jgi:uncharacterized protein involved in outer membrane biogenesis
MKRLVGSSKKILVGLLAAFAVYSLAGFFLVPYLVKTVAAGKLTELLKRQTSIEEVRFNPYSFNLSVTGFKVLEPGGTEVFASFGALKVNLQGRSLIKGGLTVKALTLDRPYVRVVHNKDLSYNFSDLMPKGAGPEKEKAASKAPLKFSFNNIRVTNGSVDFEDLPKGKAHSIREMTAEIPFISSIPSEIEIFVKPFFSATVNGTPFEFRGESKPFADSFETSLDIDLQGLNLPEYLAYSPVPLKFRMPSGTLTAKIGLTYVQFRDRAPELSIKGGLRFDRLEFQEADGRLITKVPFLDVQVASVEVFAARARVSSVVLEGPELSVVRKKDGSLNVMSLVPERKESGAEKKGPGFVLDVDSVLLNAARLSFTDLGKKTPFRRVLDPVDIAVKGFSNAEGRKAGLLVDFKNKAGESIQAEGEFSVNPVEVAADFKAGSLDLRPLQPYLDDVLNITLVKGRASAHGVIRASRQEDGLRLSYRGGASLSGFSTIDKLNKDDFFNFGSLFLNGLEFDLAPRRVLVKSVVLTDFYSSVTVGRDGRLNLAEAMIKPQKPGGRAPGAGESGAAGAADIRIESITLKGGKLDFRDRKIEPVFATSLEGLSGRVKGLYLDGSKLADLSLAGKIDRYAPFEVTGRLNPKKDDLFVDMRLHLSGFDLSSVTPYSGRYIGYSIDKGKIFLDLSYFVEKRKLEAKNGVLIDQITLGERVESPQATSLPVKFAISLLKDRRGEIRLDVPLSGSIDDPEFSVGGLVIQVIFNLLEKAVTSPFALLGSLFGGGEDLGYVEFATGGHSVTEAGAKKLDALENALYERPALKLDIEAFASAAEDTASLKEYKFMRALKSEKLGQMLSGGKGALPLDEVEIGKDEFGKYLFLAYKKADFPKEKNFLGIVKRLPAPELERLLRANTAVTDEDLRALASRRADSVKEHILRSGRIDPSRVFVRWPKSLTPEKKEGLRESRVEFKLE